MFGLHNINSKLIKNFNTKYTNSCINFVIVIACADLEGAHPAHAHPLLALICKTKKINFSLIIYTVAPPGSIFSGSAPEVSLLKESSTFIFGNQE